MPAGRAGAGFSAGLQRETASPPEAATRSGATQPAAGAARHLPAGTEENSTFTFFSLHHYDINIYIMILIVNSLVGTPVVDAADQLRFPLGFFQVPLRYLIAMLFVNFRPLWDAVIELLV